LRRLLLLLLACSPVQADEGRDAMLQVTGAQFRREAMPPDGAGPRILTATLASRERANTIERGCSGEAEGPTTAVAFGLAGDVGYWIVRAGVPGNAARTSPTYSISYGISANATPGTHDVILHAVDANGRFGPALVRRLEILPAARPAGRFVISLSWDNQADLDLHVVLPNGIEIFKRNRTEYQRPPPSAGPVPPGAPTDGGVLDRDSNANCVPDGQRAENVIWTEAPPKGHYVVRVDTFSLCGAATANWRLEAVLDGVRIGGAQGMSTENDLRFEHNRGGGLLALELDVP
jgi:hypothetical protein